MYIRKELEGMARAKPNTFGSGSLRRGDRPKLAFWLLWSRGAEGAGRLPGLTPRTPHRSWRECLTARRWSATCLACRGRCGVRCAPGARPAGRSLSMRPPKRSPFAWLRASYWGCGWTRRSARSWPGPSSSSWRTSSRCP